MWHEVFLGGVVELVVWIAKAYATFRLMKCLYIMSRSIYGHFFSQALDLTPYKDSWTVVTGCTDGIGRAYIAEMARARGIRKFFLIGRSRAKLEVVAKEMEETYGCQIKMAVFDFASDDYSLLPTKELDELPVGILINCAGVAPEKVANIAEQPPNLASTILRVNLMSTVKMIELIVPRMIERNLGIVVNVASITGWRPLPYMSSYPASKAGISFFSDALTDELGGGRSNVRVQCLIPLLVATKLAMYEEGEANPLFIVDVKSYAKQAVHVIGNYRISTGCFLHDVQIALGTLVSFWVFKQLFVPFGLLGIHKRRLEARIKKVKG